MRPLLLALLAGAGTSSAWAQEASEESESDLERAKALSLKSTQLYAEARYEEAVEALREAYELAARPALLYNMATPLERLGRWQEALDALKGYRPSAKPEELDAIDRRITSLELKVAQQRADKEAMEKASSQPVAPVRKGPPAGAWVLLGTGAVGLGSGTVFTLRALSARSDWTGQCTDADARICPTGAQDAVQRDRSSSVIADISWIVGVGATGAGLAIALGGKKGAEPEGETARVWLHAAPQQVGLTVVPGLGRRAGGAR